MVASIEHHQPYFDPDYFPPLVNSGMDKSPPPGSITPTNRVGVTLSWHDLNVHVPIKRTSYFQKMDRHRPYQRLLHNLSGIVYPGSLVAIMGASGAGKSTLLNVLGNQIASNFTVTGSILANGIEIGPFITRISGYVHQEDLFYGSLTVYEHLQFMARIKMDRRLSFYERSRRIEQLLTELGLHKCRNSRIGNPGGSNGISGGERKRLAFATEILTDPQILFCDEPTTGLDSYSAQRLVELMRDMSNRGKTILCSIHQPSSQIFSMFSTVCLLGEGKVIYMGSPQGALDYFTLIGYSCPPHFNPAEFLIKTTAIVPGEEAESRYRLQAISNQFVMSSVFSQLEDGVIAEVKRGQLDQLPFGTRSTDLEAVFGINHHRCPFWITKTAALVRRALVDSYRNPHVHVFRSIQKIFLGLLVGLCFVGLELDQEGIQGIQGALFVFINENTFPALYTVLNVFPGEFPLFLREHKSGLYQVDSYYLARIFALIPGFIIEPTIFTSLGYWIVGMRPTLKAWGLTVFISVLNANTASAFGCWISALSDNVSMANSILAPISFIFMCLGGFYLNLGSMAPWISWVQYTSLFRHTNEALNIAQWEGISNITCSTPDTTPDGEKLPCLRTGDEVLESRNFSASDFSFSVFGLIGLYLIFHVGAYASLLRKSRRS